MSFVVEIPSVFTKATQIPVRLGNTILTGNETIQGSLSVNGSLILNSGYSVDNTNVVYYDSLDISNTLSVGGNVSISGDLVVGDVNVEEKFDEIDITTTSNTNVLTSIQTQVDALINFTGGGVNFRAYSLSAVTISAGNIIPFNEIEFDTESRYDTGTYKYTILLAGTYIFSFGWYVVSGSTAEILLIRNRAGTETTLQYSSNGTNTTTNGAYILTVLEQVEENDEIYAYVSSGTCKINPYTITSPTIFTSFSGSRISN